MSAPASMYLSSQVTSHATFTPFVPAFIIVHSSAQEPSVDLTSSCQTLQLFDVFLVRKEGIEVRGFCR